MASERVLQADNYCHTTAKQTEFAVRSIIQATGHAVGQLAEELCSNTEGLDFDIRLH